MKDCNQVFMNKLLNFAFAKRIIHVHEKNAIDRKTRKQLNLPSNPTALHFRFFFPLLSLYFPWNFLGLFQVVKKNWTRPVHIKKIQNYLGTFYHNYPIQICVTLCFSQHH